MRDLAIAYGSSRQAKKWANKTIRFDDLKDRLKTPIRTPESAEEYAKMNKAQRDACKDKGGFVPAALKNGSRRVDAVEFRSMVALDGDSITKEFMDSYEQNMPYASCLYSTHSSTPEKPRVRIVIPMTRDASPDEFVAVSRYVAQSLGIDQFDECSYLPNQLMYWPSCPSNGVFIYKETDKDWLDPDKVLSAHPEWTDPTRLPTSSRESSAKNVKQKKAADPLKKEGVVGTFNRTFYPITKAIEKFLPDVYEPTDNENRWHYTQSHSMAGLEILDEGRYAYSHHAKDPAYLRLCNAFDLVRVHRFGDLDEKESFLAMCDFAMNQDEVKMTAAQEKLKQAEDDFKTDSNGDWMSKLQYSQKGTLKNSLYNIRLILENDPRLKNIVFNELADSMEVTGELPWRHPVKFWRDADDAQLICYVEDRYGAFSQRNYDIAMAKVTDDRSYHPIKQYFEGLPAWDGTKRVDTLFVDYLGAEDTPYVRAVTRKTLCAAYMRIYHPGIKFDNLVVLNGEQGLGKSMMIASLGMQWFSDSLNLSDMNDKTAAEKLQGYWILEIGELAGMKKAEVDKVKAFVSSCNDNYRAAFGKRNTPHPRQCIFIGTTNSENGFLRDVTGNRRYWNVKVSGNGKHKPWDLTQDIVDQVWAETKILADAGEKLYLDPDLEKVARDVQRDAMEQDDREGIVREYLDMLLPESWDTMDVYRRREYFQDQDDPTRPVGVNKRTEVSNIEIWCECFGKPKEDIQSKDSYAIAKIMSRFSDWNKPTERRTLPIYGRQRVYTKKN